MFDYVRDPAEIYRLSSEAIREVCDFAGFDGSARRLAERLVHACGMPDILNDLVIGGDALDAAAAALSGGGPIFTDAEMVAHGVIRASLPNDNNVVCTLNDPNVPGLAKAEGTTRSAAAVDLWGDRLGGAVVAIGNAPTALFRLLELLDRGAPQPAAIFGFPVGFIGAAESKEALIEHAGDVPFATLRGRRGGSALAAAAVNAISSDLAGTRLPGSPKEGDAPYDR